MRLGLLLMSLMIITTGKSDTFTMGYLTGSQRLPGDQEYQRPGLTISGAISLAVDEVNRDILGRMGHKLDFIVAETYGKEKISVLETANLRVKNVSVYIGPQETCEHEAFLAASFNLPMISYYCTHNETSDKTRYSTFARTRPPDSQISKSVASVLIMFNWTHVVLLYLKSSDSEFGHIATVILNSLNAVGVTVVGTRSWNTPYHHEYAENPFHKLVEDTYRDTRIYVILGHHYEHLGLMIAMKRKKLFDKGEYFVIGVDINQYDKQNPTAYFRGLLREENDPEASEAFRNYIGVVASSPVGYESFTELVNSYMVKEPFNFPNPLEIIGQGKKIRAEAAFLYDAVHIYAKALKTVMEAGGDVKNGTAIINYMKRRSYNSAMGYMVYMDENGDAEGNYSLIARKSLPDNSSEFGLFPVGIFTLHRTNDTLPVVFSAKTLGIPTQQEQVNLLTNVQEVFENIKLVIKDEGKSTDISVVEDVNKTIRRSLEHLTMAEELAIIKLMNLENQNCTKKKKGVVQKNMEECLSLLRSCGVSTSNEIKTSSFKVSNITSAALAEGQVFLDSLRDCATGPKLQLIQCYRNIIAKQVVPLKKELLEAVQAHKSGHLESVLIRAAANDCVDDILRMCKEKLSFLLNEAMQSHTFEILSSVMGGIVIIVAAIIFVLYRNWKYEQELDSLLWKVDFRDIQMSDDANANSIGTKISRPIHPLIRTSQVSLSSNPDADFRYSSIFTQIGIFKGRVFAIKKIYKKSIDITREMKKEFKMIRDIRHDNLNAFIGACTDPPNICIITEYCTRGSLKDILENEDVKLDNVFIASLVGDILRGMIYLHESPIRFHGSLHTANCLVDSRWVVKLSDFGLREFKRGADDLSLKDPAKILEKCGMLLYRAPELLRISSSYITSFQPIGSQKGDVYSFSIILYELFSRHGPFGETGLSAAEILNRLIHCGMVPFRPQLDTLENCFDFVRECLKECWAENPEERPDFKSIRTKLRPLRKGMKPNIFDNMMAMMEKYANNLEVLVDERTDQLQEEKKKTEALLFEMLPRPVAEQLKRGHKVEAEGFDCVTIYFSDIVGFTAMSAESTPLEVVDFLNDLYTCFDSIIENYGVYKVETIGDAYMVVSGLPIRNDNQHAAEIATMSLHLLSEVKNFTIRHRTSERLMLRIGIHSGPVCAGVVGLKMPRYCLFGDTVNTASRMESTGLPLKVHCSKQCKDLLQALGGYHLVERGLVPMKGKGEQQTYWLIGEDPEMRSMRSHQREMGRALINGLKPIKNGQVDSNGHCIIPRSSLKNRNSTIRSPLARCMSFESPKKIRFASGENLELKMRSNSKCLQSIVDSSPCRKSANSLVESSSDCCNEPWKTSSTSCPCIENLANSTVTLAQSQFSMFSSDDKSIKHQMCSSVPSLHPLLNVPKSFVATSAPNSPRREDDSNEIPILKFLNFEGIISQPESIPLLKITNTESQHV